MKLWSMTGPDPIPRRVSISYLIRSPGGCIVFEDADVDVPLAAGRGARDSARSAPSVVVRVVGCCPPRHGILAKIALDAPEGTAQMPGRHDLSLRPRTLQWHPERLLP